jgi:hypothetical protein
MLSTPTSESRASVTRSHWPAEGVFAAVATLAQRNVTACRVSSVARVTATMSGSVISTRSMNSLRQELLQHQSQVLEPTPTAAKSQR